MEENRQQDAPDPGPESNEPSSAKKDLNVPLNASTSSVMRVRLILGLALGILGICFGVVGVMFSLSALTIIASICAVVGCFLIAGVTLLPLMHRVELSQDNLGATPSAPSATPTPANQENSVVDPVTDLPDGRYFEVAVESRVAAARRHLRPVSVVLLQIGFEDDGPAVNENASLMRFSEIMRKTLREADIACRLDHNTFGLILEDTSEEGGVWTAERIQIALSQDVHGIRRLVAGVAAYPTHGLYSKDVLVRAGSALARASSTPVGHGFGQVEVAHVDLS